MTIFNFQVFLSLSTICLPGKINLFEKKTEKANSSFGSLGFRILDLNGR